MLTFNETCIGVLGIRIFTSRDIGCYPLYFHDYGILCSMFWLLSKIIKNLGNWEDFQFSGPQKLQKVTEKPFNTPHHHQISIVYLSGIFASL